MRTKTLMRTAVYVFAVIALAALALVPAAPAEAVVLGYDVQFTGVVQTVGSATEPWVIGGQTLAVDATTNIIKVVEPVVPGLWADVAAKKQDDGSLLARQITVRKEKVRLRGELMSKPEDKVGDWVIAGVTIKVTEDTKISTRAGEVAVGQWAEAVMTEEGGVLTAQQITGIAEEDAVTLSGEIQEVTGEYWLVSGIKLFIQPDGDNQTLISGTPKLGLIAHTASQLQEDGTLLAGVLRAAWIERTNVRSSLEFTGVVTKMELTRLPVSTLEVTTVAPEIVYQVVTLPNTRIHQEKGLLVKGATVHVVGKLVAADKVMATAITVLESPEEGGEFASFRGEIKSLPAEGKLGLWMVGEQQVLVDEGTLLLGGQPKVGAFAMGGGIKRADGVVKASRLTVFAPRNR